MNVNQNYNKFLHKRISKDKMFKRVLPIARRSLPFILKLSTIGLGYFFINHHLTKMNPIHCLNFPTFSTNINMVAQVLPNIIRIQHNGQIIGYAYCFNDRYIVSVCHQLFDNKIKINQCDLFLGDTKIKNSFKIVGKFENLTFLYSQDNILNVSPGKQPELFTQVQIIESRYFLNINNGYFVANHSGFGIVNGKGQVGNLVLNQDGIVGIITQIGRDSDQGFLRMILWKDMKNIVKRLMNNKQNSVYLGMSVVSSGQREGISVVRVAPNSPLSSQIKMGDIIKRVNNHAVRNSDDLMRIIMLSQKKVSFEIEDQDRNKKNITVDL